MAEQPTVTFTMKEVAPVEDALRKAKPGFQASVKQSSSDNPFKNLTTVNVVQNVVNYNITKTNFPKQGAQLSRSFVAQEEGDEDSNEGDPAGSKILDFELDSVNVTVIEPQRPSMSLSQFKVNSPKKGMTYVEEYKVERVQEAQHK